MTLPTKVTLDELERVQRARRARRNARQPDSRVSRALALLLALPSLSIPFVLAYATFLRH